MIKPVYSHKCYLERRKINHETKAQNFLAGLLTLCMAVGMAVPAFAAGDPLTISFYYGGAEYGYYQMGWVDVGDIDTDADGSMLQ